VRPARVRLCTWRVERWWDKCLAKRCCTSAACMTSWVESLGATSVKGRPYHPQSQGPVERAVRDAKVIVRYVQSPPPPAPQPYRPCRWISCVASTTASGGAQSLRTS
jgi:hypothetical protein